MSDRPRINEKLEAALKTDALAHLLRGSYSYRLQKGDRRQYQA